MQAKAKLRVSLPDQIVPCSNDKCIYYSYT